MDRTPYEDRLWIDRWNSTGAERRSITSISAPDEPIRLEADGGSITAIALPNETIGLDEDGALSPVTLRFDPGTTGQLAKITLSKLPPDWRYDITTLAKDAEGNEIDGVSIDESLFASDGIVVVNFSQPLGVIYNSSFLIAAAPDSDIDLEEGIKIVATVEGPGGLVQLETMRQFQVDAVLDQGYLTVQSDELEIVGDATSQVMAGLNLDLGLRGAGHTGSLASPGGPDDDGSERIRQIIFELGDEAAEQGVTLDGDGLPERFTLVDLGGGRYRLEAETFLDHDAASWKDAMDAVKIVIPAGVTGAFEASALVTTAENVLPSDFINPDTGGLKDGVNAGDIDNAIHGKESDLDNSIKDFANTFEFEVALPPPPECVIHQGAPFIEDTPGIIDFSIKGILDDRILEFTLGGLEGFDVDLESLTLKVVQNGVEEDLLVDHVEFDGNSLTVFLDGVVSIARLGSFQPSSGVFDIVGSIGMTPFEDDATDREVTLSAEGKKNSAIPTTETITVVEAADGGPEITGELHVKGGQVSLADLEVNLFFNDVTADLAPGESNGNTTRVFGAKNPGGVDGDGSEFLYSVEVTAVGGEFNFPDNVPDSWTYHVPIEGPITRIKFEARAQDGKPVLEGLSYAEQSKALDDLLATLTMTSETEKVRITTITMDRDPDDGTVSSVVETSEFDVVPPTPVSIVGYVTGDLIEDTRGPVFLVLQAQNDTVSGAVIKPPEGWVVGAVGTVPTVTFPGLEQGVDFFVSKIGWDGSFTITFSGAARGSRHVGSFDVTPTEDDSTDAAFEVMARSTTGVDDGSWDPDVRLFARVDGGGGYVRTDDPDDTSNIVAFSKGEMVKLNVDFEPFLLQRPNRANSQKADHDDGFDGWHVTSGGTRNGGDHDLDELIFHAHFILPDDLEGQLLWDQSGLDNIVIVDHGVKWDAKLQAVVRKYTVDLEANGDLIAAQGEFDHVLSNVHYRPDAGFSGGSLIWIGVSRLDRDPDGYDKADPDTPERRIDEVFDLIVDVTRNTPQVTVSASVNGTLEEDTPNWIHFGASVENDTLSTITITAPGGWGMHPYPMVLIEGLVQGAHYTVSRAVDGSFDITFTGANPASVSGWLAVAPPNGASTDTTDFDIVAKSSTGVVDSDPDGLVQLLARVDAGSSFTKAGGVEVLQGVSTVLNLGFETASSATPWRADSAQGATDMSLGQVTQPDHWTKVSGAFNGGGPDPSGEYAFHFHGKLVGNPTLDASRIEWGDASALKYLDLTDHGIVTETRVVQGQFVEFEMHYFEVNAKAGSNPAAAHAELIDFVNNGLKLSAGADAHGTYVLWAGVGIRDHDPDGIDVQNPEIDPRTTATEMFDIPIRVVEGTSQPLSLAADDTDALAIEYVLDGNEVGDINELLALGASQNVGTAEVRSMGQLATSFDDARSFTPTVNEIVVDES